MKLSIKYFFSKCVTTVDLVTVTEENLNGKLHFIYSCINYSIHQDYINSEAYSEPCQKRQLTIFAKHSFLDA